MNTFVGRLKLALACFLAGFILYTLVNEERGKSDRERCTEAGGVLIRGQNSPRVCIRKEAVIDLEATP